MILLFVEHNRTVLFLGSSTDQHIPRFLSKNLGGCVANLIKNKKKEEKWRLLILTLESILRKNIIF